MSESTRWLKQLLEGSRPAGLRRIAVYGSGPADEEELFDAVEEMGFETDLFDRYTEVVVVGRTGWRSDRIQEVLKKRRGDSLRVYTQEMFREFLISGTDPRRSPRQDLLRRYVADHPALQTIEKIWPSWASGVVDLPSYETTDSSLPERGVLSQMGYHVGQSGRSPAQRCDKLRRILERPLPSHLLPPDKMREWGKPGSTERFAKMHVVLRTLASSARLSQRDLRQAISDWESDRRWLCDEWPELAAAAPREVAQPIAGRRRAARGQ